MDDVMRGGEIKADRFKTMQGDVIILNLNLVKDEGVAKKVAEACMGGLGKVDIENDNLVVGCKGRVALATMGCQLSGWSINGALGSGPARILARKPKEIFNFLGYSENAKKAVLFLETDGGVGEDLYRTILEKTQTEKLMVAVFSGRSMVGKINVLARVLEMAVFRLYHLGYDIRNVVYGKGSVPVPKSNDPGLCNDAIIYFGSVHLKVKGWDKNLTEKCVSGSSKIHGKRFNEILKDAGGDFYKIDPGIFAPAELTVNDARTGKRYHAGKRHKYTKS